VVGAETGWCALRDALMRNEPACEGDSRFVSDGRSAAVTQDLAAVCARCPVFSACDSYAAKARPHAMAGFWAGRWRGKPSQHEDATSNTAQCTVSNPS
jgi:hypothetical protein